MANRIYSNVELMCEPTSDNHLVNKKYVLGLLNERITKGVECVIIDDIGATYDSPTQTLTQTVGANVNSDDVTLNVGDKVLYLKPTDKTQAGIYEVVTVPVGQEDSNAIVSLNVGNTGVVTESDVSINKTTFETGIGTLTSGTYTFTYDATTPSWRYNGADVDIATTYGITIASETPQVGDVINVVYTQAKVGVAGEFKRSEDFSLSKNYKSGMIIPVYSGTLYGDKLMQLVTNDPIVLDTTEMEFIIYKGAETGAKIYEEVFKGSNSVPVKQVTITHALNSRDVSISIYDNTTGEKVYFATKIIDENVIQIDSDVELLTADEFKVIIIA